MSEDFSAKTFAVFDHNGLFIPVARRLAHSGARVYYATPISRRDCINEQCDGDGFPELLWTDDLWSIKSQVDCFVFPDVNHRGEQKELRSQGYPVWGAFDGMRLELDRQFFLKKLAQLGLDVPEYSVVDGLSKLHEFLRDKQDYYIKVSRWRGSWETFHWRSFKEDGHHFDNWAVRFGGLKELIPFLCFPAIETDLEIGADTYCIDGKWPAQMLHGIEKKDEAYFAAVTKREDMPEQLRPIMEAFSPFLKQVGYRCQWSMEVRVTDDKVFFIDATTRGGLPSTHSLISAKNFPEIIWHGAHGELVEPDYGFKLSAECMVKIHGEVNSWETIVIPDELKDRLHVRQCCEVDGNPWFPADDKAIEEVGWLVATGDTPKETLQKINDYADALPDGANACVESLADVIREIEEEKQSGIHFTEDPMPAPEIVLDK